VFCTAACTLRNRENLCSSRTLLDCQASAPMTPQASGVRYRMRCGSSFDMMSNISQCSTLQALLDVAFGLPVARKSSEVCYFPICGGHGTYNTYNLLQIRFRLQIESGSGTGAKQPCPCLNQGKLFELPQLHGWFLTATHSPMGTSCELAPEEFQRSSNTLLDGEKSDAVPAMACEDTTEDAPEHDLSEQRSAYCKIFFGGTFLIIILIFTVFSIFWGSLWKIPVYNLQGWVVVRILFFS
jgi:hypothetical protein